MNAPLVRPLTVHRPGDNELSRRLQAAVQGEVRFDRATRGTLLDRRIDLPDRAHRCTDPEGA